VLLPGLVEQEADLLAFGWIGSTIDIRDVARLALIKIVDGFVVELIEYFRLGCLIDTIPVNVGFGLGSLIQYNPLVLGGTTGEFSGIDAKCVTVFGLGHNAFAVLDFVLKDFVVVQVAVDCGRACDPEFVNTDFETGVRALVCLRNVVSFPSFLATGGSVVGETSKSLD
jgi:hypothetical protein